MTFNPFIKTDAFSMQSFNDKFQEIVDGFNEEIKAAAEATPVIAVGSYQGTGEAQHTGCTTQTFELGFAPKAVFISRSYYFSNGTGAFMTAGHPLSTQGLVYGELTETGFTVGTAYVSGNCCYPDLNTVNQTYRYLAIG